jgi:cytochrome c biogenesis protein ResB
VNINFSSLVSPFPENQTNRSCPRQVLAVIAIVRVYAGWYFLSLIIALFCYLPVVPYVCQRTRREVVAPRILERVRRTDIIEDRLISDQLPSLIQLILNNGWSNVNT